MVFLEFSHKLRFIADLKKRTKEQKKNDKRSANGSQWNSSNSKKHLIAKANQMLSSNRHI